MARNSAAEASYRFMQPGDDPNAMYRQWRALMLSARRQRKKRRQGAEVDSDDSSPSSSGPALPIANMSGTATAAAARAPSPDGRGVEKPIRVDSDLSFPELEVGEELDEDEARTGGDGPHDEREGGPRSVPGVEVKMERNFERAFDFPGKP